MTPLESPPSYQLATSEQRAAQSNGIGPEKWPKVLRELVTAALHDFKQAAEIHDWEFGPTENDGTRWKWHQANKRFHRNCKTEARNKIAWWRLLARRAASRVADGLYLAVESESGWEAYHEAYQRNQRGGM